MRGFVASTAEYRDTLQHFLEQLLERGLSTKKRPVVRSSQQCGTKQSGIGTKQSGIRTPLTPVL